MMAQHSDAETVHEADLQARQAHVLPLMPEDASILEVGSGAGQTLRILPHTGRLLLGVDISPDLLKEAHDSNDHFENVQADAEHLPLKTNSFDVAVAQEVLEHVSNWQVALEELCRVARRQVVVTVPYREWPKGQRCPECGQWVPLYGHIHQFSAAAFAPWQERGRMSAMLVRPPLTWRGYWKKAAAWLCKRPEVKEAETLARCPSCKTLFSPGLRWQRMFDRAWRLLTRKPEWLLVVWELAEE